ncbi:MAG: hypothetical protein K8S15_02670 [Candidatus Aegiribacteria sp.]|nr:hypothetical protein [Candidatus Aegiribacteria sp.]
MINEVREVEIISLYIWGSGQSDKGDNRLISSLQPDSSITLSLPSGKCNILAFDELRNSYGIAENCQKNAPDTITIDLEYITFGRPNVDYGHYVLNLTNSLYGFALDTLILSSEQLNENIVIDDFRIFPGTSIIIWLDEGIYSINAVDQIGRTYSTDNITVPTDNCMVSIVNSMVINPEPPIGITGCGSGSLLIENCLPTAEITELQIIPQNGLDGIFLDNLTLQSGASMVAKLNPGIYSITATDEFGAKYTISFEQQDTDITRLPITYESLQYDFSFPIISREQ